MDDRERQARGQRAARELEEVEWAFDEVRGAIMQAPNAFSAAVTSSVRRIHRGRVRPVTIVIAHVAFEISFIAMTVRARARGIDWSLEDAALDLGAGPVRTFATVTLPMVVPGVVAAAMLSFALSLDDFIITFFVGGPGSITFPVKIYSMVKTGVKYEVNAASTILIFITILATVLAMKLQAPEKSGH